MNKRTSMSIVSTTSFGTAGILCRGDPIAVALVGRTVCLEMESGAPFGASSQTDGVNGGCLVENL
jgi:hypothetical protein